MKSVNDDMPNADSQELTELAWRQGLTPDEQARLFRHFAAHPQARSDWECEAALTRALDRLPPAPVSSNFTALVLQAVRHAPARPAQPAGRRQFDIASWLPSGWRPRVALGLTMVCLSFLTVRECQAFQRQRMARDLASVGSLASLQPVDCLQNFQTIANLSRVQVAPDDALLEALR